jgi:lysozyme family protein
MADYNVAFSFMMDDEDWKRSGVVTDEPNGGKARFGINSLAHPEVPPAFYQADPESALEYAKSFYFTDYWTQISGTLILDQDVANKYLDLAVNLGVTQITKIVQRAAGVTDDGVLGPQTLRAINTSVADVLLSDIRAGAAKFYQELCDSDPEKYQNDIKGWLARAKR